MNITNPSIETIRKACITANPEIMKLGFGCRVKRFEGIVDTLVKIICLPSTNRYILYREKDGMRFDYEHGINETENWKILGRPIRLADVLLALPDEIYVYKLSGKGHFSSTMKDVGCNYWNSWDLKDDDLTNQSPKTLDFLADLLKETK